MDADERMAVPENGTRKRRMKPVHTHCLYCGKEFSSRKRSKRASFCNYECLKASHRDKYAEIDEPMTEAYLVGCSATEIGKMFGLSYTQVRQRLIFLGVKLRTHEEAARFASPKISKANKGLGLGRPKSDEHRKKLSIAKTGKGKGFSLKPSGYISITMGEHKDRSQHDVIMEKIIGRRLLRGEVVHHKDHNRSNNDPSNLQLMTQSEHTKLHAALNPYRKLSKEQVEWIRSLPDSFSRKDISKELGVSPDTLWSIRTGRSHKKSFTESRIPSNGRIRYRVLVDGIESSLEAAAIRLGSNSHTFKDWMSKGLSPQEIADHIREMKGTK